jgi:hypothetical protein
MNDITILPTEQALRNLDQILLGSDQADEAPAKSAV